MALIDAVKVVVAWRRSGGPDTLSSASLANRLQVPLENLPLTSKARFLDDTAAADAAFAQGKLPTEADQLKAINAFMAYMAQVFSDVTNKQEELIRAGKTRMLWLEDYSLPMEAVGVVVREAAARTDATDSLAAFARMKEYAIRNKANREAVSALLAGKGKVKEAAAVVSTATAAIKSDVATVVDAVKQAVQSGASPAQVASRAQAAMNEVRGKGSSTSSTGSMLPKVLAAAAVAGVGYFLFFRRR